MQSIQFISILWYTIMGCNRILLILFIAVICDLAQTRNLPEWPENLSGTCICTIDISNQEVTYNNGCAPLFRPSSEVLVMPMYPGTGSPRVKFYCICDCELIYEI